MLLELAIGDAYGAGFEYVRDRRFINANNNVAGYVKHPSHRLSPGDYTDDTQMSLAIAELVVEEEIWTAEIVADRFAVCFHRDPREGYSGRFYEFLKRHKTGAAFLADIDPKSDKSGAAMRAAPIGVYPKVEEVIQRSSMQAQITHNTPAGVNAAVAVSLATHYFMYDIGPKADLPQFLKSHVAGNWEEPWLGEVGSRGWMSVRAAITSLLRNDSLSSILRSAVAWSGDVDTVAAIAMAMGFCSKEIKQNLPERLVKDLERGEFGIDYIRALDTKLARKVTLSRAGRRRHQRL